MYDLRYFLFLGLGEAPLSFSSYPARVESAQSLTWPLKLLASGFLENISERSQ